MVHGDFPAFTDLQAIAEDLEGKVEYRRLRTAIEKAVRTQSCVSDLTQAATCCDALDELLPSFRRKGTLTRSATEASLLLTAVLLYERATAAGAKRGERGSVSISHRLNETQRIDHEALVKLRQRAIAHVYAGEPIEGEIWHHELLFAVESEEGWKPASASHRMQFDGATFARLKRQIPIAHSILTERFHDHTNELTKIMNENPVPLALFEKRRFDPMAMFGNREAVRAVLDGQTKGRTSFLG